MRRNPVVPISDAVNGWLARRPYLREGLMEQRLIEVFSESITPVKRYVTSVECRRRILFVRFSSSAVRGEMNNRKKELIALINTRLASDYLIDIHMS